MNERQYRIGYGCGCGDNEDYITAVDLKAAQDYAYEEAVIEYEIFEGLHGIRGVEDIAEQDYEIDPEVGIDDEMYDQIYQDYLDEREGQLDYWAEEITEHEYLIGIGEIDEDEEDEEDE